MIPAAFLLRIRGLSVDGHVSLSSLVSVDLYRFGFGDGLAHELVGS